MTDDSAPLLSVAGYNVHGLRDPENLARTFTSLAFVDIWAFQEVYTSIEGPPESIAFHESDAPDPLSHLLSPENWNVFFVPMNRQQQIDDLNSNILKFKDPEIPVILLGDFNTTGFAFMPWRMNAREEVTALRDSMRGSGMQALPGSTPPLNTFKTFLFARPLDHIFLRNVRCMEWGTTTGYAGSDHRPLWMRFQVEPSHSARP